MGRQLCLDSSGKYFEVLKDPTKLNSEVRKYLEKNNNYTEHHLKDTKEFQKKLFEEIKGRINLMMKAYPILTKNIFIGQRQLKKQITL